MPRVQLRCLRLYLDSDALNRRRLTTRNDVSRCLLLLLIELWILIYVASRSQQPVLAELSTTTTSIYRCRHSRIVQCRDWQHLDLCERKKRRHQGSSVFTPSYQNAVSRLIDDFSFCYTEYFSRPCIEVAICEGGGIINIANIFPFFSSIDDKEAYTNYALRNFDSIKNSIKDFIENPDRSSCGDIDDRWRYALLLFDSELTIVDSRRLSETINGQLTLKRRMEISDE